MAKPKTLSFEDMMNASLGRNPSTTKSTPKTKTGTSADRLAKTNIGKGKPSSFQNPDFSVPTVSLGLPNQKELQKAEKKLSTSQTKLAKTSIGKGMPNFVTDKKTKDPFESIFGSQALGKSGSSKGLLVDGMTNRSQQKITPGKGLPTVYAVGATKNFRNESFFAKPSKTRTIGISNIQLPSGKGTLQTKEGSFIPQISVAKVSPSIQSQRSRGASQSVSKSISALSNYSKLINAGPALKSNLGNVFSVNRSGKTFQTQSQFSQNIKLASAGLSLTDSKARAAVAASSAASNARLTKVSRARNKAKSSSLRSNPNLARANAILAEQGADYKIGVYTRRRRRGRWETAYVAIYTGPSTRRSYSRTIHNGRRVTAYRGYTTGQRISGRNTSPDSIVQTYERNKAISAFGSQQGISKNEGESQASHASRVTSVAQAKRSKIEQYIDPIGTGPDSVFGYATIGDEKIGELESYHGDLTKANKDYDANIDILRQGIAKVQTKRGKASGIRKASKFLNTYDQIEAKEQPYTKVIQDTSAQLSTIGSQLNQQKSLVQKRGELGKTLNQIMGTNEAYSLDTASSTITNKITAQKASIKKAEERVAAANTPAAKAAARRSYQRMSRGAKRRYRSPSYSASLALRSEQSKLSHLQSVQSQISTIGQETWGDDKINSGIIATPGNRTITGARTRKNNWYRGAPGSTTIKIPKDKIPASGKVIVEANVSYTSGYKGRTHATGTFGTINKGSKVVRKELPVDANGNIKINMHMYGTKYGSQAKAGISNIKVIDPTSTQRGAELFGNVADLSQQQSQLQTTLRENQNVKNYFDDAQEFLTGKSKVLKDKTGKTVASYNGNKLSIQNESGFKDIFGEVDSDVFGATRAVYTPINKLKSDTSSLIQQKESILAREATRGKALSAAVTQQVNVIDTKLQKLNKTTDFFSGSLPELKINDKVVATRGQLGKITVVDDQAFKGLGITLPSELVKQKPKAITTKKFASLEATIKAKETTQKNLIAELKTVQTERIKETAAARSQQVDQLVAKRAITRRDAIKMKGDIAKDVKQQTNKVKAVGDNVPLPDIEAFDTDLRSEAQKILDATEGIVKSTKKANIRSKLRQVTRSRKPGVSPVGAVLKVGATVPRPRPAIKRQTSTTLGAQKTSLRNPFLS